MFVNDPFDLVLQLHSIARQLEQVKHLNVLGSDLRKFADQVNRVHASRVEYEKLDPMTQEYIEYLAHLGE